jgi:hypothetical protein
MSIGDKLIIAGVVTVPVVSAVFFGALVAMGVSDPGLALFFCFVSATVAVAVGWFTTGILMRKNRS